MLMIIDIYSKKNKHQQMFSDFFVFIYKQTDLSLVNENDSI